FCGAYHNRTIGGSDGLLASSSAIPTHMLVPVGGNLVSIPKYLVVFFRASQLFRPVPSFRTSGGRKISYAVLAGHASAGWCLFFADADRSATIGENPVRIVIYIKNISKRISSTQNKAARLGGFALCFSAYFKLKNAFMPGYSAMSPSLPLCAVTHNGDPVT